ncbi:MAG: aminotransferase class I/II-fold pyridoxal phosphate-dependent enzyme [Lachnospiraceae bacterium]|nr:aminotransferase class I/II-fold pyridoxal phosphate-dependent enzyme [Lachnospiraceae bacterium]
MISFESDYITGCHPEILKKLAETNLEALSGYGSDKYSESASKKILEAAGVTDGAVFFISGGTQTNQLIISTMLQEYQGVVAAETGHVAAHEAGAIEYTGHEVLTVPGYDGKLKASDVKKFADTFYNDANHEHMVFPGMVYISHPTEYGTLYTLDELKAIRKVCDEFDMSLFIDGARLGYGLMSFDTDVSLKDIAKLSDVFYVGGTKVGALCGEAVVFTHGNTPVHFVNRIKRHGALLAKGRLCGIQFDTLFTDDLYFNISRHAIEMAELLKEALKEKGYKFYIDSPTNQQFVVLDDSKYEELSKNVAMSFWEKPDESHTVVRLATCWSTTKEDIETLKTYL